MAGDDLGNNFFAKRLLERDILKLEADELRNKLHTELNAMLLTEQFQKLPDVSVPKQEGSLIEEEQPGVEEDGSETTSAEEANKEEEKHYDAPKLSKFMKFCSKRISSKTIEQEQAEEAFEQKLMERQRELQRQAELEKLDESDESVEWTRDRHDAEAAIKLAKKNTKSAKRRMKRYDNFFQRSTQMKDTARSQPVDWENDDADFIQYDQMYAMKPVPLNIDRFMAMCYPPIGEEFLVRVVSFVQGAFFLTWKELDEERRAFEEKMKTDKRIPGMSMKHLFPGDVIAVRAGSKDIEWKRAVVQEVHKRANKIYVQLVEYGMTPAVVNATEAKNVFQNHYNGERGRIFFACRFVLDDRIKLCEDAEELVASLLEKGIKNVEMKVRCSRIEGRTAFGQMWIRCKDTWLDFAGELAKITPG